MDSTAIGCLLPFEILTGLNVIIYLKNEVALPLEKQYSPAEGPLLTEQRVINLGQQPGRQHSTASSEKCQSWSACCAWPKWHDLDAKIEN